MSGMGAKWLSRDDVVILIAVPAVVAAAVLDVIVALNLRAFGHDNPGPAMVLLGLTGAIVMASVYLVFVARRPHVRRDLAFIALTPFGMIVVGVVGMIFGLVTS
jgi:hypothetical protein